MSRIRIATFVAAALLALAPLAVRAELPQPGEMTLPNLGGDRRPGTRVQEQPDFTGTFVANGQAIGKWQRFPTGTNRFGFFTRVWSRSSVYVFVPSDMVRLDDGRDYLFMTYIRYAYNPADPTNVDYWRQEMSGRIFVNPSTNTGAWAVDDTYEAFGARGHDDNPQWFSMGFLFDR